MICSRIFALAFTGLAATLAAGSPGAIAAPICAQWDVGGKWSFLQSGQRKVYFDIQQNGNLLEGEAINVWGLKRSHPGKVDGIINGSAVESTVYWSSDSIGVYHGEIKASGQIEGVTFDKLRPKNRAIWQSEKRMGCLMAANTPPPPAQPPPPEKKKTKVLGKKRSKPIRRAAPKVSCGGRPGSATWSA